MDGERSDGIAAPAGAADILAFGPFRLQPARRALFRDGERIALGGRDLDLLQALLAQAGEPVPQRELMARVWPGLHVDDANLRVHVASLRRALEDGRDGIRYIETVPRRGYCFVAEVRRTGGDAVPAAAAAPATPAGLPPAPGSLPPALGRTIGRAGEAAALVQLLAERRFVTIAGAGGMGKTVLALDLAHALQASGSTVALVDLAALPAEASVTGAVAAALGLVAGETEDAAALAEALAGRRLLLVLDNCEHLLPQAAALAERIFARAPGIGLLATSREPLRAEGEQVHRLPPLALPPAEGAASAAEALAWPAVQLFMERAAAGGHRMPLGDVEAPCIAAICRRLDGIPLALELAAARVATHGIAGTAELLEHRCGRLWQGRRNAAPRHRTMHALVDWSHALLPETERLVLRRLSVLAGSFGLREAQRIAADESLGPAAVAEALAALADRSLVWTEPGPGGLRYRLPYVTLCHAAERLEESGEAAALARRKALLALHDGAGSPLADRDAGPETGRQPLLQLLAIGSGADRGGAGGGGPVSRGRRASAAPPPPSGMR